MSSYVEVKVPRVSVRVYNSGRIAIKPYRHRRWVHLRAAEPLGRKRAKRNLHAVA